MRLQQVSGGFLLSGQSVIAGPFKPPHQVTHFTLVAETLILIWVIYTGHWALENTFFANSWTMHKVKGAGTWKRLEKCLQYGSLVLPLSNWSKDWTFKRNKVVFWNPYWFLFIFVGFCLMMITGSQFMHFFIHNYLTRTEKSSFMYPGQSSIYHTNSSVVYFTESAF